MKEKIKASSFLDVEDVIGRSRFESESSGSFMKGFMETLGKVSVYTLLMVILVLTIVLYNFFDVKYTIKGFEEILGILKALK